MVQAATQTYDIQVVAEMQPNAGGMHIRFPSGLSATLRADHPDYDLLLLQAEGSKHRRVPVGVIIDEAGNVVDLSYAHQVTFSSIQEDEEDPNRLKVAFWGFCAICYVTQDHPEFERIRAALTEAAGSRNPVLLANRTWPVEGETEVWNQILDVRPAGTLEYPRQSAGTTSVNSNGAAGSAIRPTSEEGGMVTGSVPSTSESPDEAL